MGNLACISNIGCGDILTVTLILLKLIGVINWAWVIVLMPTIAPLTIVVCAYLVGKFM